MRHSPPMPPCGSSYLRCEQIFAALGRKLSVKEKDHLQETLANQIEIAFKASQRSSVTISYSAAGSGLINYLITPNHASIATTYDGWVSTRQPPYFGVEPDAKAMAVAKKMSGPANCRVLDIGAGTGRNALPLARLGHTVDAVELTPKFADLLVKAAQDEYLPIQVICEDVFKANHHLNNDYQMMLVSEVVSDFRSIDQLRALLELAAQCLANGGKLVMNAFIARAHYSEDDAARQFGQQVYSAFFSESELHAAMRDLPLDLISNESVHDYEQANLPKGAWPPTTWYANWTSGLDIFATAIENSPVSLRWLVLQKRN